MDYFTCIAYNTWGKMIKAPGGASLRPEGLYGFLIEHNWTSGQSHLKNEIRAVQIKIGRYHVKTLKGKDC